jgi:hypothetical protein
VVAEPLVSDDGVQEPEGLVVLDRDVAVPDHAEHVAGVAAYDSLSLRHIRALDGDEWLDANPAVEARGDDRLTGRGGGVGTGAEGSARGLPRRASSRAWDRSWQEWRAQRKIPGDNRYTQAIDRFSTRIAHTPPHALRRPASS